MKTKYGQRAMNNTVRLYGRPPYRVVLVHGGPGGAGEMSPLARRLSQCMPVVEAMQTKLSIQALIEELRDQIAAHAQTPAVIVGHSWGAWLCLLFAAHHPDMAERLILISSGVLEDRYAEVLRATQSARLTEIERSEMAKLTGLLDDPDVPDKGALFSRYGYLFDKIENYDVEPEAQEPFETDPAIFNHVWTEAAAMRSSGDLLRQASLVQCPVLAIHGDYDPSPVEGVREPLARVLKTPFEFLVLKNCGHTPWLERHARDEFYEILEANVA
ncbi:MULTISPECIES: alpha/beta hydrolase [unclassified Phenylobacterium]|uniref:alpha/beta fold hydrolase n=2 Tax=Phenylobacterium TaxID=20 RepID=UPI0009E8FA3F